MAERKNYTKTELKNLFINLKNRGITDQMAGLLIEHCYNNPVNLRTSGFLFAAAPDSQITWNNNSRTFSITPYIPEETIYNPDGSVYEPHFSFYSWNREPHHHKRFEQETIQLPNQEGLFLIHFDIAINDNRHTLQYLKNPTKEEIATIYVTGIPVAWIYWNNTSQTAIYFGDSRHGSEWNPQLQWTWHQSLNSLRQQGIAITEAIYDGDGSEDSHYQFGISAGKLWHEDILEEINQVGKTESLPVWYFEGSFPRFLSQSGKKFINSGLVAYNSGGIVQASDNYYLLYHLFATNCIYQEVISVMGKNQYEQLGKAIAAIKAEVADLRQEMPHSNLMWIDTIIIQTSDDYTNSAKARIVTNACTVMTEMSVTGDGSALNKIKLVNDEDEPGPRKYYGTDKEEVKGYHSLPEAVEKTIKEYNETVITQTSEIPSIIRSSFGLLKESILIEHTTLTTLTRESSWFVKAYNELVGNFKAVVVIHNKTTNEIITLQNTFGFDFTDSANEVSNDNTIVTDGSIALVLSVNASNYKLQATLNGMTSAAKRIHFCFERCVLGKRPVDTSVEMGLDVSMVTEATLVNELSSQMGLNIDMEGLINKIIDARAQMGLNIEMEAEGESVETINPDAFITEWEMPAGNFTLPLRLGSNYDMEVDWGDGSSSIVTSYNDSRATHNYATSGTYQIKISGKCGAWKINNNSAVKDKITKIIQWGNVEFDYLSYGFYGCENLVEIPNGKLTGTTTSLTSVRSLFSGCTNWTGPIPNELFYELTSLSTSAFANTFQNCSSLTGPIPENLFYYNTQAAGYSFQNTFDGCTSLDGSIPANLFKQNVNVGDRAFERTFRECSSLTGQIPEDLFRYNTGISGNQEELFSGCSNLSGSIPVGLFKYNINLTGLGRAFEFCSGLTGSIPEDLFRYNTQITDFGAVFSGCSGLSGTIPVGLFQYNTLAEDFNSVFSNCSSLSGTVPEDLFRYNTEALTFSMCFNGCGINTVESGLFQYNTKATNFGSLFMSSSLATIPPNLFDNNILATNFAGAFQGCLGLSGAIPADLFKFNTQVQSDGFKSIFRSCSNIEEAPNGLFKYAPDATYFRYAFLMCKKLKLNQYIFFDPGEEDTRFYDKSPNFQYMFYQTSFYGDQGIAPELWNCDFGNGTPITGNCYGGSGNSTSSLSNYNEIPTEWK